MSINARTIVVIETFLNKQVETLKSELRNLTQSPQSVTEPTPQLAVVIEQAYETLSILKKWTDGKGALKTTINTDEIEVENIEDSSSSDTENEAKSIEQDFQDNANELLVNLLENIETIEAGNDFINAKQNLTRIMHTFKGIAGMFGQNKVATLAHRCESILIRIGDKPDQVSQTELVNALLFAHDSFWNAINSDDKTKKDQMNQNNTTAPNNEKMRVSVKQLDNLISNVGEIITDKTRLQGCAQDLRKSNSDESALTTFIDVFQTFERHVSSLQNLVLGMRMVPVSNTLRHCKRIVRDVERTTGKSINLVITGQNTKLDRKILDNLVEPLVHIIRNACDHGIEAKDIRSAAGKPPVGQIKINAVDDGSSVHIRIQDDGQGLDHKRIQEIASARGLTTKGQVLTTRQSQDLIFTPGFSTASNLTQISGRGLGMDIVRKKISEIKGSIGIESLAGKGTTIDIKVPLTLALTKALIFKIEKEVFAIPIDSILHSLRVKPTDIQKLGKRNVISYQGRLIPIQSFKNIIAPNDLIDHQEVKKAHIYTLILGPKDHPFGLIVDKLLTNEELINKPLSVLLGQVACTSGGAVMSNGKIVLSIDPNKLHEKFFSSSRVI